MQVVIKHLQSEIKAIEHCLSLKDWASTGSQHHTEIRQKYEKDLSEFKKAIEILTNSVTP